jgi:hypothetical protein
MDYKPILSAVAVALVFTACGGTTPTEVTETVLTPAGDGAIRTQFQQDIDFGSFTFFEPCFGETVTGRFRFLFDWAKTVTPSGKSNQVGKVTYHPDTQMVGHDTGDVWTPTGPTRQNRVVIEDLDGDKFVAHNNTHEVWMNQHGDKGRRQVCCTQQHS